MVVFQISLLAMCFQLAILFCCKSQHNIVRYNCTAILCMGDAADLNKNTLRLSIHMLQVSDPCPDLTTCDTERRSLLALPSGSCLKGLNNRSPASPHCDKASDVQKQQGIYNTACGSGRCQQLYGREVRKPDRTSKNLWRSGHPPSYALVWL